MKNITLLLFIVLSLGVNANGIEVLTQGSCWYQQTGDGVKVSSFNEGLSYSVSKYHLNDLAKYLNTFGIKTSSIDGIETYLHCSGLGASFVFKVYTPSKTLCTWSKFEKDEMKFQTLDLADDFEGRCDGVIPDKLIVGINKGVSLVDLKSDISSLGIRVVSLAKLSTDSYVLEVKALDDQIFDIKKTLLKAKGLRYVDLVTRQHAIGDSVALESLGFKK